MKPMKLEGALKLYMVLYFIAFLTTFLMSVPMLLHVVPMSECLLFVDYSYDQNRKFTYGNPNGCYAAGVLPLVVAVGAIGLMFVQYLQLTKLRDHLRNPEMSSDEYRYNCRKMFWRMIIVHSCLGALVLVIACILSAGYALTCRNMYLVVEKEIRARVAANPNPSRQYNTQNILHENFASDHTVNRYLYDNLNAFGQNRFDQSITCRSLLTDKINHYELKKNHRNNQFYAQHHGFWNNDDQISDVGNFEHIAFTDNLRLECSLAGAWLSAVIWSIILMLMIKERHHLRAHITDQSMWGGSEYNHSVKSGKSRQSARNVMTPVDFDVRSNASRVSKASKSSRGTSYKDMGGSKRNAHNGSSSYKNMSNPPNSGVKSAVPSRLTVSRLEQVPSLPADYGLQKLLGGGGQMEPPNDTSSVANMSVMTVTGTVFGPGMEAANGNRGQRGGHRGGGGGAGAASGGLMDYFASQTSTQPMYNESDEDHRPGSTQESDIM